MLVFRILCAVLVAWATNWALSRPEAATLLAEHSEMRGLWLGPIAGFVVGYFNLAVRQGWGFVVAFANGVWAGVLSIILAGILYTIVNLLQAIRTNTVRDFDQFLRAFGEIVTPLFDYLYDVPLLTVSLGATALVGIITEFAHWLLVRVRQRKGQGSSVNL